MRYLAACFIALLTSPAIADLVTARYSATYPNFYNVVITVTYDDDRRFPSASGANPTIGIERVTFDIFRFGDLIYSRINVNGGTSFGSTDISLESATGELTFGINLGDVSLAGNAEDFLLTGSATGETSLIATASGNVITSLSQTEFTRTDVDNLADITFFSELDAGWTVIGEMMYDPTLPEVQGSERGFTEGIDRLVMRSYDPTGTFIDRADAIEKGYSTFIQHRLQFDTAQQRLVPASDFDLGLAPDGTGNPAYFGTVGGLGRLTDPSGTDFDSAAMAQFRVVDNNVDLDEAWYRLDFDGGWSINGLIRYDNRLPLVTADGTLLTDGIETLTMTAIEPGVGEDDGFGAVGFWFGTRPELNFTFEPTTQTIPAGPFAIGDDDRSDVLDVFVSGSVGGTATLSQFGNPIDTTPSANMFIVPTNQGTITVRFRLDLDGSWSVLGTMTYNSDLAMVSAFGTGPTNGIQSLDLAFVNPSGQTTFQQAAIAGGVGLVNAIDFSFDTRLADFDPRSFLQLGSDLSGEPVLIGDGRGFSELAVGGSTVDTTNVTRLDVDFRCNPADLVAPFGIVDLGDIDAFVVGFVNGAPVTDLAAPFGVFDLSDIDAFIAAFLAGCP